jgi:putative membrane protein
MGFGYGYAGMTFMWLPMIICAMLLIAGLAVVILVTFRFSRAGQGGASVLGAGSARRILDDRYARGDIDHDEYRKRRDLLV